MSKKENILERKIAISFSDRSLRDLSRTINQENVFASNYYVQALALCLDKLLPLLCLCAPQEECKIVLTNFFAQLEQRDRQQTCVATILKQQYAKRNSLYYHLKQQKNQFIVFS